MYILFQKKLFVNGNEYGYPLGSDRKYEKGMARKLDVARLMKLKKYDRFIIWE